jgi:hypothetical protein
MRSLVACAAAAATLACGIAVAAPASAATRVTGPNLIRNGNAEAAPGSNNGGIVAVPSWTLADGSQFTAIQYGASGGFPSPTDPAPKNRGANFFGGGPDSAVSIATQTRPLADYRAAIDAGTAKFTLVGYLGGFQLQGDNATVEVDWLSGTGKTLGTASIGPVTPDDRAGVTGLFKRSVRGAVPMKARQALITVTLTRSEGSYDDGYADNLSLKVSQPSAG